MNSIIFSRIMQYNMDKSIIDNLRRTQSKSHVRNLSLSSTNQKSNKEIQFSHQNVQKKKILRNKILSYGSNENFKDPSYFIDKARISYLAKYSKDSSPIKTIAQTRTNSRISKHRGQKSEVISYNTTKEVDKNLDQILPNWLVERPDFKIVTKNYIKKDSDNIPRICAEHPNSRTYGNKRILFDWISSIEFFSSFSDKIVMEICGKLVRQDFPENQTIIRKGEEADNLFIIFSGSANVYIEPNILNSIVYKKSIIGEQALITSKPVTATIISREPMITLKLNKFDYESILLSLHKKEKIENLNFLSQIQLFKPWSKIKLQNFSCYLSVKTYKSGEIIYDVGHPGEFFLIIKSGLVEIQGFVNIIHNNCWPTGGKEWKVTEVNRKYQVPILKLSPGEYFGETPILENSVQKSRSVSLTPSVCLSLTKQDFFEAFTSKDIEQVKYFSSVFIPSEEELKKRLQNEIKIKNSNVKNI
jgi:CRP-like cAMP-binding protein